MPGVLRIRLHNVYEALHDWSSADVGVRVCDVERSVWLIGVVVYAWSCMLRVTIGHPDGDSPIWPHGRTMRSMLLQMGFDSLRAMSRRNHASRVTGLADVTCSGSLG